MIKGKYFCYWDVLKSILLALVFLFLTNFDLSGRSVTLLAQEDDVDELEEEESQDGTATLSDDAGDSEEEEEEEEEDSGSESNNTSDAASSDSLVEPCDVITFRRFAGSPKRTERVFPVDSLVLTHKQATNSEDEQLRFYLYRNGLQRDKSPFPVKKDFFYGIEYFEERAFRDAAKLISIDSERPRNIAQGSLRTPQSNVEKQKWQKAERLLKAGISEHDSLVEQALRDGRAFAPLRLKLLNALVEMELMEINQLVDSQRFDEAEELCEGLAEYAPDREHKKRIHQLYEAISLARSQSLFEAERYKEVRDEIERLRSRLYPSFPSKMYQGLEEKVQVKAKELFKDGKKAIKEKRPKDAKQLLAQAIALSPGLPNLSQAFRDASENHEVLKCVFIDECPKNFSPLSAENSLDRHAVSLLFEGLVRWSREPFGNCFTSELIDGRPQPLAKGRKFRLKQRRWSDASVINSNDVRRSLDLVKKFHPAGYPPFWEEIIGQVLTPENEPFIFEIGLKEDHWSPLTLMTFPILPMHYFPNLGANPAELKAFNEKPVGTGAYMLDHNTRNEHEVRFHVNPHYPTRPPIEEVHFKQLPPDKALTQMTEGKIDLLYDVRKDQVEQLERQNIDVKSIKSNVVYMLIPNYSRSTSNSLKTLALRRAISYSINREEILNQFFRPGGQADLHTSLQGIFPKTSWASHPELQDNSSDASAKTQFKEAKKELSNQYPQRLTLTFPDRGDVEQACNEIKNRIQEISNEAGEGIEVLLKPCPINEYDALVKRGLAGDEYSFDLAYWKYEYLDGTFSCVSLFDAKNQSNLEQYDEYYDLHALFTNLRTHKHFMGLRDTSREIDKHIASYLPVIPLWRLDTFIAFSNRVDLGDREIDPIYPFRDVKSWELK